MSSFSLLDFPPLKLVSTVSPQICIASILFECVCVFEANIGIVYFLTILRRTNEKESEYHHIVILIPEGALFYPTLVSTRAASSCCPPNPFPRTQPTYLRAQYNSSAGSYK